MVKEAGAGGAVSGSAVAGLAIAAVAAITGGLVWYVQRPAEPEAPVALLSPGPTPQTPVAETPAAKTPTTASPTTAKPQTAASAASPEAAAAAQIPPGFDTVRVTPEGQALVAGRARPGAEVQLRIDDAEVARATADGQGTFVALFDLAPSDAPRMLTLVQLGTPEVPGRDSVALAPTSAPATTAAAEAEAEGNVVAEAVSPAPAPAPLLVNDQGATVLQSDLPPGMVSIASIAYTPGGGVQLAGQGDGGANLRIYLDNAPVAEALVATSGQWFATLRDVTPGLYTLRADQLDASGKVTARFETPFLRETPEALAAALKPRATPGQPLAASTQLPEAPVSGTLPRPVQAAPSTIGARPAVASLGAPSDVVADPVADVTRAEPAPAETGAAPLTVTVQPGFTLWRIARENFGDGVMYVKVFEANKAQIRNPDLIYPGQVFTIPQ
ncbi:LysM peptidoglycan-binding domain-containing protein [Gemmobacter serpentinus]|uniref:LysM peptidoglycan-binding domain-containing protein n=1 Tax=Gemmobacter serpentinus TaxID=2652247 RepID=UPI001CF65259|nr:LysM peptidoglycan-binding domain-containing protein [Gemmobacter serpentinus]